MIEVAGTENDTSSTATSAAEVDAEIGDLQPRVHDRRNRASPRRAAMLTPSG